MKTRLEQLRQLQRRQQYLYREYLQGKLDTRAYLIALHPLDRAIDRIELSFLIGKFKLR